MCNKDNVSLTLELQRSWLFALKCVARLAVNFRIDSQLVSWVQSFFFLMKFCHCSLRRFPEDEGSTLSKYQKTTFRREKVAVLKHTRRSYAL